MTADRVVKERIVKALALIPGLDAEEIAVSCRDGIVTLRGAVATYQEKHLAACTAVDVAGVRALASYLDVLPANDSYRGDTRLAEAVASALAQQGALPTLSVLAVVQDGWVTLRGRADWRYQRAIAEDAVRALTGVKGITNSILVARHATAADIQARIAVALKRGAEDDARAIRVHVHDGEVTLTGTVRSIVERREAERAVRSAPGVVLVDDRLATSA